MIELVCKQCGKKFEVYKYRKNAKYCSHKCYHDSLKGTKQSNDSKLKNSISHRGEKSPLWRGGTTTLLSMVRRSFKYRQWVSDVFTRDNWTCQKTGIRGGNLEAHHIKSFHKILEDNNIKTIDNAFNCSELWDINNGITFKKEIHKEFHSEYGSKDNNQEQLFKFLNK